MLTSLNCKGCSQRGNVTIRTVVIRTGTSGHPEAEQDRGMRRGATVLTKELVDLRELKDLISPYNSPEWPLTKARCLWCLTDYYKSQSSWYRLKKTRGCGGRHCLLMPILASHHIQRMKIILPSLAWVAVHLSSDATGLAEFCNLPPALTSVGRALGQQMTGTCVPVHSPQKAWWLFYVSTWLSHSAQIHGQTLFWMLL